jgi:phosphate transport system ATP-binding protein
MTNQEIKIEVKDLHLYFGEKHVLKGINLSIPKNSIVSLIGPSGCGKSSLLRSMNRMHDLNGTAKLSGDILVDGENILGKQADPVAIRRKIGMVFQRPNPFPKSIFKNIAYGLEINGMAKNGKLKKAVENALKDCYLWDELADNLGRSALEMSGGQQQRLCIARTIAIRPDVLLMDEPCSALDPISTAKIEELILKLKEKYTIIIVTHNMQQAMRVSDYTGFMYLGELVEFDRTEKVFRTPGQDLTKRYVEGTFG